MDLQAQSVEAANVASHEDAWRRVRRNWSVRIGGTVLALLVLVAVSAPLLGTVDPTLFDAASRDLVPGKTGEITTLDGEYIKHTFVFGSDSFGRDIYSRVMYGTRVSLIVGLLAALLSLAFGILCGLSAGYLRWLDGILFGAVGIAGFVLAFLTFVSLHTVTNGNLNLMWALPTHVVPAVALLIGKNPRWLRPYMLITLALAVLFLLGLPFWPQDIPAAVTPFVIGICARAAVLAFPPSTSETQASDGSSR